MKTEIFTDDCSAYEFSIGDIVQSIHNEEFVLITFIDENLYEFSGVSLITGEYDIEWQVDRFKECKKGTKIIITV